MYPGPVSMVRSVFRFKTLILIEMASSPLDVLAYRQVNLCKYYTLYTRSARRVVRGPWRGTVFDLAYAESV